MGGALLDEGRSRAKSWLEGCRGALAGKEYAIEKRGEKVVIGVSDAAGFGQTWKEGEEVGKGKSSEEISPQKATLLRNVGGGALNQKPREAFLVHKPAGGLRYSPKHSMLGAP